MTAVLISPANPTTPVVPRPVRIRASRSSQRSPFTEVREQSRQRLLQGTAIVAGLVAVSTSTVALVLIAFGS